MIEQLKTSDLSQVFQRFVKDFVRVLEDNPTLDMRIIRGITLAPATAQAIDHGLGRQPVGWFPVDVVSPAIWAFGRTAWDTRSITLLSPGAITMDILVF
jgi:hypothetical protein